MRSGRGSLRCIGRRCGGGSLAPPTTARRRATSIRRNAAAMGESTAVKQTMDPLVSVIIATRNRQVLLSQTLEALAAQNWPRERLEVVVAGIRLLGVPRP